MTPLNSYVGKQEKRLRERCLPHTSRQWLKKMPHSGALKKQHLEFFLTFYRILNEIDICITSDFIASLLRRRS